VLTGPLIPAILSRYGPEGWRVCWYVLGAVALGISVLCALLLRNRPDEQGLTPLGETEADRTRRGAGGRNPSFEWGQVWKSRALWHLAAVYFAFGFSYVIYATFFIRYLVGEGGFTAKDAGLLWLNVGLVSGLSGFLWGGISDRWGRRIALMGVFLLQGASFAAFGLGQAVPVLYLSASLFAITAWSVPALMAALAGDVFGAQLAPAALGLMTVVFGVGQAIGPILAGRIADSAHSFAPAFLMAGAVALLLGAGGSFLLRPRPQGEA
jgi:sugar phosphate permease